jgi:hypothetical protein
MQKYIGGENLYILLALKEEKKIISSFTPVGLSAIL